MLVLWDTKSDNANASAKLTKKDSPPDSVLVSREAFACHVSTTSKDKASSLRIN
jgi:hypothetical protein